MHTHRCVQARPAVSKCQQYFKNPHNCYVHLTFVFFPTNTQRQISLIAKIGNGHSWSCVLLNLHKCSHDYLFNGYEKTHIFYWNEMTWMKCSRPVTRTTRQQLWLLTFWRLAETVSSPLCLDTLLFDWCWGRMRGFSEWHVASLTSGGDLSVMPTAASAAGYCEFWQHYDAFLICQGDLALTQVAYMAYSWLCADLSYTGNKKVVSTFSLSQKQRDIAINIYQNKI